MTPEEIDVLLTGACGRFKSWANRLPPSQRDQLAEPGLAQEIDRLSYLDGWRRIRRTTPMILRAIERFDTLGDREAARFWIEHLDEEAGHDVVMRDDLVRIFGSEAEFEQIAAINPITPPSVALVGYFEWQATQGDAHLLIALRLFLEWFVANMSEEDQSSVHELVDGRSQTLALHHEADQDHLRPCYDYVSRYIDADRRAAFEWSVDFVALCLGEAQVWVAARCLGQRS